MRRRPYRKRAGAKPRHFIAEWRIARGLSQEELAALVGTSPSNLSQIENGKQNYRQALVEKIADALQVDLPTLLGRDPADPEGIWSVWDQVPPAERARAIEVLKAFARGGQ